MKKPTLTGLTKEQTDYVNYLESWIENFKLSNISKLITACDTVSGIIADDVIMLSKNQNYEEIDNKLQMLGSKKNKIYEQYLSLVKELKHFKTIDDLLADIKPKFESGNIKEIKEEVKARKSNIQDFVLKKDD